SSPRRLNEGGWSSALRDGVGVVSAMICSCRDLPSASIGPAHDPAVTRGKCRAMTSGQTIRTGCGALFGVRGCDCHIAAATEASAARYIRWIEGEQNHET